LISLNIDTNKSLVKFRLSRKLLFAFAIIAIISGICNVTFSQGRRDLGMFQNYKYEVNDSIRKKLADSLGIAYDTTALQPVDSTARLKYFQYIPSYSFGTRIKPKTHPLLLENSTYIKKEVTFNDKNQVIIRETFDGEDIKAPLIIDLNNYLTTEEKLNTAQVFNQLFDETYKGITSDELSQLFEKITDITIPLPFKTETIFGPPTFNLKINGAVDITASFQNVNSEQASFINNNQNNINFKQEVQVNAKGSIGDKLSIEADWNTQRTFDFENQLKLKYTGYADEVIQKIEAGNVSLDTKSSLIQSTQALFGIKGEFKLGPLTLSSVVSQKKSKQEEKTFSQGVLEQNFQIQVWDYSDSHYLFDTLYKTSFLEVYGDSTGTNSFSNFVNENRLKITGDNFEVWMQCDVTESRKRFAVGTVMLGPRPSTGYDSTVTTPEVIIGQKFAGYFRKLDPSEYYYNEYAGYINLKISVTSNMHVGVVYENYKGEKFGKGERECSSNENLILKLFKIDNQIPTIAPLAWELKLKNIYRLPVSKILEDGFKLEVLYNNNNTLQPTVPGYFGNKSLATITKMDRFTGKELSPPPDGIFDFRIGKTINPETGDVIFPTLRPFYDAIKLNGGDSSLQYLDIYTLNKSEAQLSIKSTLYTISGSAKGEAGISNTFNLGLNVVLGSVQVLMGGTKLQENVDYSVDYTSGVVTIRNIAALTAKDLKITYETNDLFTLASKTFIGLRGDYKISEKTNFGFTFVNLSQETLNDKVRIGEEPTNNSMYGLDFNSELKTNFVTKALNILPGYNTKEESNFSLRGEFAYLTPDPNTKKSQIPQDNNEAIAYIDDMEGAKKIISLGTSYQAWTIASLPIDTMLTTYDSLHSQDRRGGLKWYTVPNDVDVKDVYPLRDVQPGQDRLSPMYVSFDPGVRGCYNYNAVNYDTLNKNHNWNGIMKYLNTTSTDLIAENINYIEFNMRVEKYGNFNLGDSRLYIDLGIISEDAIPNNAYNTEDIIQNGTLQESEDIGLDTLTNEQELVKFNQKNGTNFQNLDEFFNAYGNRDPAGDDNTESQTINVDFINGTEKSRFTDGGQKPDSEDLDRTGQMEPTNKYFEYSVKLDPENNKFITGEGAPGKGWYQYKIPLAEFTKNFHDASLRTVKFARVWIKGVNGKVRVALLEFNLVGNQWYKPEKLDTTYNISVINIEENSQIYMSPVPGDVLRQTVRNTSGVNTKSNEQSLVLSFNNLTTGKQKLAVKDYRSQILDLFNYKVMKLFVNGDPSFNYTNELVYDAAMVVRFGTDSTNYYEYRAPIHPDIRPGQPWNSMNEVSIVFADLTSLKVTRDSVSQVVDIPVPNGPPGAYYRIRGSPALNSIREFTLGVEKNRTGQNTSISGSVWFNEVRVLKVNDDNGYAVNVNTSLKVADFGTASFNFSRVDPNFHALDQRTGTRTTGQNWDAGFSFNVHKILNNFLSSVLDGEWKEFLNIPVTYRHSENFVNPKYYPGTDIDLEKAAEEKYRQVLAQTNDEGLAEKSKNDILTSAQTYAIRNDISVTGMSFKFPGSSYFNRVILNAFSLNFTGTYGSQRDFTYVSKTDFATSGSLNYNTDFMLSDFLNLNLSKIVDFGEQYKDAKIYLFVPFIPFVPAFSNGFTATVDYNRTRNESRQRLQEFDDPTGRLFKANRGFNFNWKFIENWIVDLTGTYSVKMGSDLTGFETYKDSARTQKSESEILDDIFINQGLINFGNDLDYQQSTTFNPKFNIPVINKFFDINMNYNVTYAWMNPNSTVFSGYNVGFANTFTTGATFKFNELLNIFGVEKKAGGYRNFGIRAAGKDDDKPGFGDVMKILGTFIPDLITVNFNQTNAVANPSVVGRPGFANFWVTLKQVDEYGPSRMYQLGFNMDPGKRVPGYSITDVHNLSNNVTFNTTISPLFPQALRMNLTFKKNWGKNYSGTYNTQPDGTLGPPTNKNTTGTDGYSMFFAGNIEDFSFEASGDPDLNIGNITTAFKDQIASFPFPNWSMTITGMEKLPLFSEFTQTVSFENSFTSEYSEGSFIDISNKEVIQRQSVVQSYNPLIGLNVTFKQLAGGSFTANFRLNKSTSNILSPSSNLVQVAKTNDWSLTANYAKSGFDIPMFGLELKNDITFSLTYSRNLNEPVDYKYAPETPVEKIIGNGSTITSFNPSVSYSISSKVQLMVFYKYSKTEPLEGNANIPPRTSNEGGLNVRVLIQ
jgi:hypothetical protein